MKKTVTSMALATLVAAALTTSPVAGQSATAVSVKAGNFTCSISVGASGTGTKATTSTCGGVQARTQYRSAAGGTYYNTGTLGAKSSTAKGVSSPNTVTKRQGRGYYSGSYSSWQG